MKISIITLFPEIFDPVLNFSILKRAQKKGLIEFELINLRDFGEGIHKTVDDKPYGGGVGMVLKADVLAKAVKRAKGKGERGNVILTSASGQKFKQSKAREFSKLSHLIIICGHYEGVDERFIEKYVDEEISIGDYILTGGEIPAMIIADSVVRLVKGVLKKEEATVNESFENGYLEHEQYTRPEVFEDLKVPEVLLTGHHKKIGEFRLAQSVKKTISKRPDLLDKIT